MEINIIIKLCKKIWVDSVFSVLAPNVDNECAYKAGGFSYMCQLSTKVCKNMDENKWRCRLLYEASNENNFVKEGFNGHTFSSFLSGWLWSSDIIYWIYILGMKDPKLTPKTI